MKYFLPSSAIFLLLANLVPIFGVVFLRWNLIDLLFLYWAESAIIGFFNILKMLTSTEGYHGWQCVGHLSGQAFLSVFFTVHYGGFMAAHAFFLYAIAHEFFGVQAHPLALISVTWIALATLFISHGYSFVANFIIKGERHRVIGSALMISPYGRIVVMHLTLIIGMTFFLIFGQPILLLLFFIVLKIGVDLRAHLGERKSFRQINP